MATLDKVYEIFKPGEHWEIYNSCAEMSPALAEQNGVVQVIAVRPESLIIDIMGQLDSACLELPNAADIVGTGYGYLKFKVSQATQTDDTVEYVTMRKVSPTTARLRPLYESEITEKGRYVRACRNGEAGLLEELWTTGKLTRLSPAEICYGFEAVQDVDDTDVHGWILEHFKTTVGIQQSVDKKLRFALKTGNVAKAKWLIMRATVPANVVLAQISAAREGNLEFMKWLFLESRIPVAIDVYAIEAAIGAKQAEMTDWLLNTAPRMMKVAAFKYGLKVIQPEIDRDAFQEYAESVRTREKKKGPRRKLKEL